METKTIVDAAHASIERRQSRLERLEAERDQLKLEIDGLEIAVNVLIKDLGEDEWEMMCGIKVPPDAPYNELVDSDDENIPITHKARNVAYKVLLETRPMHRSRLLERVESEGVEILGRKPADLLSAYLSPDARFKVVPGMRGYWTLTQEPTGKRPITIPVSEGV